MDLPPAARPNVCLATARATPSPPPGVGGWPHHVRARQYRLYTDSWGLWGHTAGLMLFFEATPALVLRVRERFHYQDDADFYQRGYDAPRSYMTSDKELGGLWSTTTGLKVDFSGAGPVESRACGEFGRSCHSPAM